MLRALGLSAGGKIRRKMDENRCRSRGIHGTRLVASCNVGEDSRSGSCSHSSDGSVYD